MKICNACKLPLPATTDYFYKKGNSLRYRCKSCHNAASMGRYEALKSDIRSKQRAYEKANADEVRARRRSWYREHPDYNHAYYEAHQTRIQTATREWARLNRSRANAYYRDSKIRRRFALLGVPSYTRREWERLCDSFHNVCVACLTERPLTVDHIVPVSRGGSNTIENIQPLCRSCNSRKGTKTLDYRFWFGVC